MLFPEVWQPAHPHFDIFLTYRASYLAIADDQIISDAALDYLRARYVFTVCLLSILITYSILTAASVY